MRLASFLSTRAKSKKHPIRVAFFVLRWRTLCGQVELSSQSEDANTRFARLQDACPYNYSPPSCTPQKYAIIPLPTSTKEARMKKEILTLDKIAFDFKRVASQNWLRRGGRYRSPFFHSHPCRGAWLHHPKASHQLFDFFNLSLQVRVNKTHDASGFHQP